MATLDVRLAEKTSLCRSRHVENYVNQGLWVLNFGELESPNLRSSDFAGTGLESMVPVAFRKASPVLSAGRETESSPNPLRLDSLLLPPRLIHGAPYTGKLAGAYGSISKEPGIPLPMNRLQSLSLRENHLDDAGIGAISEALKSNRALKELELCGNGIGDLGASSLGLALVMNMKLSVLNLQDNLIGDPGADGLAVGIERNKVLQELDLGGNGRLGNAGVGRLAQALGKNSTLRSLGLQGSSADPEAVQCLEELAADPAARRTGESDEVFETPLEGDAFGLDSQLSCGSEESSSSHSDDSESDHEREVAGL
ncbi:unnamed protein product [Polarella glacialis]|uniref:Uncharacterized protein n=1 Tax=Polarella glacialis TaxID=89957 RepID=A0A813KGM8_POLGL|nr:unnamed protein product [Polarella glacialis]